MKTKIQVVKKKSVKKKKKKGQTALQPPKLRNTDDNTIVTHGNYTPQQPYAYKVQYYNKSQLKYTPFVFKDKFLPKFRLPVCVTPSVDAVCNLSLPDPIIDGIVHLSNTYALACTKLEETTLVGSVVKRNTR